VPTKGRYESLLTIKTLENLNLEYTAVIEAQEYDNYAKVIDEKKLLVVPHKNKGLTVTRNWIWDYAEEKGYEKFWTFDDNIDMFFRLNKNLKVPVSDGTILKCIEDFSDRYTNAIIVGMNYFMFASRKSASIKPYTMNTRIYSNMLIHTKAKNKDGGPLRNVTFYNDDTDLCLRVLKQGDCTVLFNAFLIGKATTMTMKGGMTEYYKSDECEGRKVFAQELVDAHPDVARVTWKFNRWHHQVNYQPFKKNKLIRVKNYDDIVKDRVNNYGMKLITIDN
jgi:hypothetical protein